MAGRGRPRKPTNQKKLEGTYRKDRENPKEPPILDVEVVEAPNWLNATGSDAYLHMADILKQQKSLSLSDLQTLAIMSDVYSDVVNLTKQVRKEGRVYTSETELGKITRPNPKFQMLSKVRDQFHRYASEFGMTPASRAKVIAAVEDQDSDPLKKLMEM